MAIGLEKRWIKSLIWARIARLARRERGNWLDAAKNIGQLLAYRRQFRGSDVPRKYARVGRRYFWDLYAPGFPSRAFDDYIAGELARCDGAGTISAPATAILAITRRCPLACEHCCEWDTLNAAEVVTASQWARIASEFQALGTTQFFLSGGEPLSRLPAVYAVLESVATRADVWLLSSGIGFGPRCANDLKGAGLTGLVLSLDHPDRAEHDRFRGQDGAFDAVLRGAEAAHAAGLAVALGLVPTRRLLTSAEALDRYRELAVTLGAGFIQLLEPKAIGHYSGVDVALGSDEQTRLAEFAHATSFAREHSGSPVVCHPDGTRRANGCQSANRYVYLDTRAALHRCPFCRSGPELLTTELGVAAALERLRAHPCSASHGAASRSPDVARAEGNAQRRRKALPVLDRG
jgi:molybdenum cofactor biosynthesis enzyme MoaA